MNNYIVYVGYLDGVCVYVGEGKPERYKHLNSGISHVYEANYYHHSGKVIEVNIYKAGLTKKEAEQLEEVLIGQLKPLWNKASCFTESVKIAPLVEKEIKRVFGNDRVLLKSKERQLEVIRYLGSLLDKNGCTRVSSQQTEINLGCPRIMNSATEKSQWKELKQIFDIKRIKKGLWEVHLICLSKEIPNDN